MRLFFAIELPDDVRAHLIVVRELIRTSLPKSSFTRDENLHITLKFLGEVDERKLDELIESMSRIRVARSMELAAQAIECFPARGLVRVVAAGFGGDLEQLAAPHSAIEQRCAYLGFERETRRYRPHVTLARARPVLSAEVRRTLDAATGALFPGPTMRASGCALLESRLRPTGSEYRKICQFEFVNTD